MNNNNPLCLLMLAGEAPSGLALADLRALLPQQPYMVAADGGAKHLANLGLMPQLLVGDGDSLDEPTLERCRTAGVEIATLPQQKDFTDGEAALRIALERGYTHLAVFGALGGGLDHQLGNLLLPLAYRTQWQSLTFHGTDCRAQYCFSSSVITGRAGDTVSLLPLSPTVRGLTLHGFRYPLNQAQTGLGQSLCLRNELSAATARVELAEGIMLIIHYPLI